MSGMFGVKEVDRASSPRDLDYRTPRPDGLAVLLFRPATRGLDLSFLAHSLGTVRVVGIFRTSGRSEVNRDVSFRIPAGSA
jgi:hypothetical protein